MQIWSSLNQQQRTKALSRPAINNVKSLSTAVKDIIKQVKLHGDDALFTLTEQFDRVSLTSLKVNTLQIEAATKRLSQERKEAIQLAYQQIERFHRAQAPKDITVETLPGVVCSLKTEALESVGLYIPAGTAPLPSTVLMLGVPAQIAGCERVVLACPPDKNGQLADEVLYAARLCHINEIYNIGGAQAIAALAIGTESIRPVRKIFGPGNRFVTEAKTQLAQSIPGFAIDMPAGPSELLIIADAQAQPSFVAADLLSQAEHGSDSQVILISDSERLILEVKEQLEQQLKLLSRQDTARQALAQSRFIITDDLDQAVDVSNQYGPEHLSVQTAQPKHLLKRLRNAGSIFIGPYSPESAGDYASGTNHVLPTYGYAKVASSLSLIDFSRRYTVQELSKQGLAQLADTIIELTDAEGLDAHQRAVTIRFEDSNCFDQNDRQEKNHV
ncbi:histidinol dehydrogenase [Thalassotalea aquiviva]|uniref:histidinol dehydrogenase n=1 Tax=Thalassotalea aquiviva TaxID=3242415 RepID=UPI00352A9590